MITLRPYQYDDICRIREAFRRGSQHVLYTADTGAGKTVMFSELARLTSYAGNRVCIVVHRRELIKQTSRALTNAGVFHSVVAPGYYPVDALVTVASKDTLHGRTAAMLEDIAWELVVIDEAHHAVAATYQRIIKKARWVLGVTATPIRMGGRGLISVFDTLVLGPQLKELTPQYLSPFHLYAPPSPVDFSGLRVSKGDYVRKDLEALMDRSKITGNAIEHYAKYLDGKSAFVFCASVAHAQHVSDEFNLAGYRAAAVWGAMPNDERDHVLASIGDGRLDLVMSCDLISEGLDVPSVHGAISLRKTKSLGLFRQQVGRVLRKSPEKPYAVILDHTGNCWTHGLPDMHMTWSLTEGAERRPKEKELLEKIRQCPECYFAHDPAPECPACGYVYKVKKKRPPSVVQGMLEKVDLSDEEIQECIRRARSLQDWQSVAKRTGKSHKWAWVKWKMKLKEKTS